MANILNYEKLLVGKFLTYQSTRKEYEKHVFYFVKSIPSNIERYAHYEIYHITHNEFKYYAFLHEELDLLLFNKTMTCEHGTYTIL